MNGCASMIIDIQKEMSLQKGYRPSDEYVGQGVAFQ
jgi:hypothetical protein